MACAPPTWGPTSQVDHLLSLMTDGVLSSEQCAARLSHALQAPPATAAGGRRAPPRKCSSFHAASRPAKMLHAQQLAPSYGGGGAAAAAADGFCVAQLQQLHQRQQLQQQLLQGRAEAAASAQDANQLMNLLLSKVVALTAEKEQLAARCTGLQSEMHGLQSENKQLTHLVVVMGDTLKKQQQHSKILLQLAASGGASSHGSGSLPQAAFADEHEELQQLQQAPLRSLSLPLLGEEEPVVSCTLPSPGTDQQQRAAGAAAAVAPAQQQQVQLRSKQQRVAEWLDGRMVVKGPQAWQEWQQCLPLEPMSSSSSLHLALEDAQHN